MSQLLRIIAVLCAVSNASGMESPAPQYADEREPDPYARPATPAFGVSSSGAIVVAPAWGVLPLTEAEEGDDSLCVYNDQWGQFAGDSSDDDAPWGFAEIEAEAARDGSASRGLSFEMVMDILQRKIKISFPSSPIKDGRFSLYCHKISGDALLKFVLTKTGKVFWYRVAACFCEQLILEVIAAPDDDLIGACSGSLIHDLHYKIVGEKQMLQRYELSRSSVKSSLS